MISLNLLSGREKKQLKKDLLAAEATYGVVMVFIFIVVSAIIFFTSQKYLEYQINQLAKDNPGGEETRVVEANKKMAQLAGVQNDYTKWSVILKKIIGLIPENIKISGLELNKETQRISMFGFAEKRADYLQLEENFRNSELMTDLQAPVANLLRPNNFNFSLEATLKNPK